MSRYGTVLIASLFTYVFASAQTNAAKPDYTLLNAIASCRSLTCVTAKQNEVDEKLEPIVLFTNVGSVNSGPPDSGNRPCCPETLSTLPRDC